MKEKYSHQGDLLCLRPEAVSIDGFGNYDNNAFLHNKSKKAN